MQLFPLRNLRPTILQKICATCESIKSSAMVSSISCYVNTICYNIPMKNKKKKQKSDDIWYPVRRNVGWVFLLASPIGFVLNIVVYLQDDMPLGEFIGTSGFILLFFTIALMAVRSK